MPTMASSAGPGQGPFAAPTPLATSAGMQRSPSPTSPTSPSSSSPSTPFSPGSPPRRSRGASITESIFNARPPPGFCAATGEAFGRAPTLADLRRDSVGSGKRQQRNSISSRRGSSGEVTPAGMLSPAGVGAAQNGGDVIREEGLGRPAESMLDVDGEKRKLSGGAGVAGVPMVAAEGTRSVDASSTLGEGEYYDDDETEKQKPGWWKVTKTGLAAFWKWFWTPLGFFITIYMLNVVAWGGMLFLLLCNASPAMCNPTCNDINSPRRIWIEIDSQILNALFCVTGFGLIPWRFRDLYYLLKWRCFHSQNAYLKLQEIHSAWYRAGNRAAASSPSSSKDKSSEERDLAQVETGDIVAAAVRDKKDAPPSVPPEEAAAAAERRVDEVLNENTITGEKAAPTKSWKLDYVIWLYCWNTFFQCCLSGFMWGMNRYDRPSWSTGLFVALACGVAGMAGGQVWWETRKVKKVEGDPKKVEVIRKGEKMKKERVKKAIEEEEATAIMNGV